MNELSHFPATLRKCTKIFIISDEVSENINHILRTAWVIKWANVTALQTQNNKVIYLSPSLFLSLHVCVCVSCLCVRQHQTERVSHAFLFLYHPPTPELQTQGSFQNQTISRSYWRRKWTEPRAIIKLYKCYYRLACYCPTLIQIWTLQAVLVAETFLNKSTLAYV